MANTKQGKCMEESRGGIMGRTVLEKLNGKFLRRVCVKELRDTTNFFLKNTYKSLQDFFSGSHYIETKKMASLIFLFSNILAREGVIIEQKSRKIA